jgi:hypothetical protein
LRVYVGLFGARTGGAHASREQADHAVYVAERALVIALETRSYRIAAQLNRIPALLDAAGADEQARTLGTRINLLKSWKES